MKKAIYVTKRGAKKLFQRKKELFEKFKNSQGKKGEAAEVGGNDWHDNFSFEEICRQEQALNKQIEDVSELISSMQILDEVPNDTTVLRIGLIAGLEIDDEYVEYLVGGYEETDFNHAPPIIAYDAPLIRDFFLEKEGKEIDIVIGGKKKHLILQTIRKP